MYKYCIIIRLNQSVCVNHIISPDVVLKTLSKNSKLDGLRMNPFPKDSPDYTSENSASIFTECPITKKGF